MATKKSAAKTPAAKTAMPKMTPTSATKKTTSASSKTTAATASSGAPVRLLSGGNPQITKGSGDAPVQAYIAALSGWKSDVVAKLDALIEKTVPGVHKAVKWNTPFYGVDEGIWFIGVHVLKGSVQLTFFAAHRSNLCLIDQAKCETRATTTSAKTTVSTNRCYRVG